MKLRRRRAQATLSFYDNADDDDNEHVISKWTIVRRRLPDILALSETYKPTSMRAQLVLLVASMHRQAVADKNRSRQATFDNYASSVPPAIPTNVVIEIDGRSQVICLKRIPSEQVIHVDVDGLSLSIPTRQFILAISRGQSQDAAMKYCPSEISDMLINLSKTKIIDDRKQLQRAKFRMRMGQSLFYVIFIFIAAMMLALMIGATYAIVRLESLNHTKSNSARPLGGSLGKLPIIGIRTWTDATDDDST